MMRFGEETDTITTVTDCASSTRGATALTCAVAEVEGTWVVEVVGMNLDEEEVAHLPKEPTTEL